MTYLSEFIPKASITATNPFHIALPAMGSIVAICFTCSFAARIDNCSNREKRMKRADPSIPEVVQEMTARSIGSREYKDLMKVIIWKRTA